ncbi:arginine--tRNA ligase [Thermodesulforhabdus norvegica]|uniref:Arginine--tRNA ligase n=1 Tax=Thermodesulforhabdus norvegica TaxID=39841 RepID=A0A1I4RI24_9BACT|nr:arginine--tRNA ligase [Thermodesulforhabdus norvegica]SFM51570.1 arginyl-tRNA synthetase [Thermodesulforhabdus norvegica]
MLVRDRLRELLILAVRELSSDLGDFEPEIEIPSSREHGHYATNAAMMLARTLKQKPRDIASRLVSCIEKRNPDFIEKIEVAGPGFVNFFIYPDAFTAMLPYIVASDRDYGKSNLGNGRYVQVEFVSANPTGPLHIGHGRGAATGDSIARILEACGYRVQREYYINDTGKQMEILGRSLYLRYLEALGKEIEFPEDHYKGQYMKDLAAELLGHKGDTLLGLPESEAVSFCAQYAGNRILEGIKKDLEDFRVTFDEWFSEKGLHEGGKVEQTIEFLRGRGHIYEKDGALWFRSTAFGDEKDRVVVRSNGATTYFAADIAYHWNKFMRGFDTVIDIWGADHHGYVARMKAAVEALGYDSEQLRIVLVQLVNLLRGGQPVAMSTRAGEFVTLREVMDEVGVDAARYIFLTRRSDSHLDFDLEVAKQQSNENPVYYVQYAHARLCSLFEVARERGFSAENDKVPNLSLLREQQELDLIRLLGEYPHVVASSAIFLEPHRIPYYLHELVSEFHSYYNHHRILGDDTELALARLYLARALRVVIRNALELIGVSAPERM